MNETQKAAIQRAMVLIDNTVSGAYKLQTMLKNPEVTIEQVKAFSDIWLNGVQSVGNAAKQWLEAAYNDKDYPEK